MQGVGGRVVADSVSDLIQYRKAQTRFQIRVCVGDGFEFLIGCHQGLVRIAFSLFPGLVGDSNREQTGPVIVDVGIEVSAVKVIEQAGLALRDVGMAEQLAHHVTVLAFHQGIVVAVPGTGLGKLDTQFLQQPGDPTVDVFRAVVGVEPQDDEREARQQVCQGRDEVDFTDALDTDHDLELGHFIHGIDMIDAFFPVQIALVHGIDAYIARLAVTLWLAPLADRQGDRAGVSLGDDAGEAGAGGVSGQLSAASADRGAGVWHHEAGYGVSAVSLTRS